MPVQLTSVLSRRDLKQFIYLPERLHRDHPRWMPPIYMDEWKYYDPKKNRAFTYCDATLMVAWKDGEPVGRVMGIINRRHNEMMKEQTARFACLECTEDREVAHALLAHVEDWARGRGMTKVIGPFGFNDQDPEGFLIEGFEHEPTIVTYYNFPYLIRLLEAEGYGKEIDYVVYRLPVPAEVPELIRRVAERARSRGDFRVLEFTRKSQLKPYIRPILGLMNETFVGIYGYSPLDPEEMEGLAKQYLPLLDPRFVKAVLKGDEVVGFMIAIPNLYEGIVKAKGHLFPFGFIHILRAMKAARQLDLLLGGIKEAYRGRGVDMVMGEAMLRTAAAAGFQVMDSHHELETNTKVRAEMERGGGVIYKRYRIFQKPL
jgi:GNAT superfamily N-acetyltransferase